MRLGVLDIGSNTGHLLVVDAHAGAAPMPASSFKEPLRLAEHLDEDGAVSERGIDALTAFVADALRLAEDKGCEEIFAVLEHVREHTGARLRVLSGEDEARLTFLAVRRWFGWSSGRLGVFDIGGGSLEIAAGSAEAPDVAWSLPLGAGRLSRTWFADGTPDDDTLRVLRRTIRADVARDAGSLLRGGPLDHAVATSKTFRSLSRICGSAPSSEGLFVRRMLPAAELEEWLPKLASMTRAEIADLPGVSPDRAHQVLAGAFVASAVLDIFELPALEICPWALREGIILDRFDKMSVVGEA
jgi:exopolyphosphatase/guanosine-5'-triphosphate,3'-diphosphate pyrophosphatase